MGHEFQAFTNISPDFYIIDILHMRGMFEELIPFKSNGMIIIKAVR